MTVLAADSERMEKRDTREAAQPRLRPGMRRTRQRQLVWDALHELSAHCTAEEIAAQVRLRHPSFPRSTVYRALETMLETGDLIASRLDGGALRYELARSAHPHAICNQCGRVFHLNDLALQVAEQELIGLHDFEPTHAELTISGLCAACRAPA